jgi:nucleoside-diphosphate-sugar epimerase
VMHIVAVTGATGSIGRHVLNCLCRQQGVAVRALAHKAPDASLPQSERLVWVRGDVADVASVERLLVNGCDLVHLAYPVGWARAQHLSVNLGIARAAVKAGVRRVIHCSTAAVVGRTAAQRITEGTFAEPVTDYEVTKLAIERAWLEPHGIPLELAVLRPTAVYGPGVQNLLKLALALTSESGFTNYARSSLFGRRRMHLVHVENVVAAIDYLLNDAARQNGEIYIVSDDDDPLNNFRDVEKMLMQAWGIHDYPVPPLPVPKFFLSALLRLMGRSNYNPDRVYDDSKLQQAGLQKPYRLERGLREFASWYVRGTDTARGPT